jgi:para-aminobenzoate synthetase component 1
VRQKTLKTPLRFFDVFLSLRDGRHPFFLDSTTGYGRLGSYSFAGVDPFLTFTSKNESITITRHNEGTEHISGDPLEVLRGLLAQYRQSFIPEAPPFIGGAVGYLGYDLCHFIEALPRNAVDDVGVPDCFFGFYDGIYVFDHSTGDTTLVTLGIRDDTDRLLADMESRISEVLQRRTITPEPLHNRTTVDFCSNMAKEEYLRAINRIREYILAGDIYQVNFTQRLQCPFQADTFAFAERLRSVNPAPFSAYIDTGNCTVLSSSPERFIKIRNGVIETRPIKGTCRRGNTEEEDRQLASELLESDKNRSELLMIVDLERNDLGRIAKTGTVRVTELFALETYATVHHLVATITAEIDESHDLIDCIKATFPGGSITGAPKIRSMEIIDELEPTQRNVYTGSIGYLGFDGAADLNIAIRTVLIKDGTAYLQVGGGITWDSDAEEEYEESLIKAKALMEALS